MSKNQKVQLRSVSKESNTKSLEVTAQKLKLVNNQSNETSESDAKQTAQILTISKVNSKSSTISKNNHRTPIKPRVVIGEAEETPPNDSKQTIKQELKKQNKTTQIPETNKVEDKNNTSSDSSTTTKQVTNTPKIKKPNPKTTCTCESLQTKEVPLLFLPKKPEPQNVPKYRWIAVKSESLKTEEQIAAEIRLLLPKNKSPQHSNTTVNTYRKPRLCQFCWRKLKEEKLRKERETKEKKERELMIALQKGNKRRTEKKEVVHKDNRCLSNQFSYLLDEESA